MRRLAFSCTDVTRAAFRRPCFRFRGSYGQRLRREARLRAVRGVGGGNIGRAPSLNRQRLGVLLVLTASDDAGWRFTFPQRKDESGTERFSLSPEWT